MFAGSYDRTPSVIPRSNLTIGHRASARAKVHEIFGEKKARLPLNDCCAMGRISSSSQPSTVNHLPV